MFKLFDRMVSSPHRSCFYTDPSQTSEHQEYHYNGTRIYDIRAFTIDLRKARSYIEDAVNGVLRNMERHPLEHSDDWKANVAFCNLYVNGQENVGYHSDQLTYLGPMCTIASLSLGVSREFRIREMTPGVSNSDSAAQPYGIHLPHNSLLIMHAGMQESYKHSLHPGKPKRHNIADFARINVTYRFYRDSYKGQHTPRCKCGMACILRCVMKQKNDNLGKYYYTCAAGYREEMHGCDHFEWAKIGKDGELIHQ